ncbi:glycosyltransferase family 4 protein [Alistipes sp. OttesenSCG-928-L06]|nr:glycosyltransferase family 4 protein [Alistipes sp. OttesenSCG-928-L06]
MKVLFTFGGTTHYINRLLEILTEKGIDVTAVIADGASAALGQCVKLSENEKKYKVVRTPELKSKRSGKPHFPALPDIVADEKPDIVVFGWPYFLDIYFEPRLLKTIRTVGAKLIVREIPYQVPPYRGSGAWFDKHPMVDENMNRLSRGLRFKINSAVLRRVRRYIYKRADGAINYHSSGPDIISTYGIPREKIFVTLNSTDTEALWIHRKAVEEAPPLLPPNPHRILHVGRLVKFKRFDLLFQATRNLIERYPDVELLIVGEGPELEKLRRQAAETGIADRVHFTGAVYDSLLLHRYMYESSVYVLAGMGGLSINDAMACGLPVICSAACDGTHVDLIEPGCNGYVFREGHADSLTDKLAAVFADDDKRRLMGQHAYETIRNRINLDTVSDRFIAAFNAVLS